ncbi:MAG: ABC transporter ATP-binding protein [Candidatus Pelethousia sp.]|nr:ABC transporter ATP-binding protein [Candidatus Pelethousia sp.]
MKPIVELRNIVKQFPGVLANDHVNFAMYPGETHALVGENGAGKSTLMKILYGQYAPDQGEILIDGAPCRYNVTGARRHGIGMVYQNFMQIPDMCILENIILGNAPAKRGVIDYAAAEKKVGEYLQRFKMRAAPNAPLKSLSVGERQKIEIIKSLYFDARILILDEPTAVLTPQESYELFQIIDSLKAEGRSVVFISHKLREVITVGDRITVMRKGRVVQADWMRGDANEVDIARAMIGKKDVQLIQNQREAAPGSTVMETKRLWYFDELGVPKLRDLSMQIRSGEILGIGGVEGNGQDELIHTLIGMLTPSSGEITIGGKDLTAATVAQRRAAGMGFISDDRMTVGLVLDGTIEENVIAGNERAPAFSKGILLRKKEIARHCEGLIDAYDIKGLTAGKQVKMLSGGNMQKIVLAREISRNPKVLIAAQPTRGLDIGAINFVRELLLAQRKEGTAVILVSADLEELISLSDRIIILFEGSISGEITDVANVTEEKIGLLMGGASDYAQ